MAQQWLGKAPSPGGLAQPLEIALRRQDGGLAAEKRWVATWLDSESAHCTFALTRSVLET
jgi:hypothetical protein